MMVANRLVRLCFLGGFVIAFAKPAWSDFKLCNQTLNLLNVAVGSETGETYQTEGWWTVPANGCVTLIKGVLKARFIYVYASDIYGEDILSGFTEMCIDRKQFVIKGTDGCWQRGFEKARFHEVDTKSTADWTMFIREKNKKP